LKSDFPRVLFVTPLAFNHFTGGGVTFTNLFRGWPKDRLFTVHADTLPLSTVICVNYFALGADELPLSGPLQMLRRLAGRADTSTASTGPAPAVQPSAPAAAQAGGFRRLLLESSKAIFGDSGFPVSARLSLRLASWIEAARPDVIYTILGSIEMMELVDQIRARFDLPVVVHLMDDWRVERERHGLLSPLRRKRLNKLFDHSMRAATGHLAISDVMASVYGAEFGVRFEAVQNVIDSDQWLNSARQDIAPRRPARLLYAGSIYEKVQLSSLIGIAAAVSRLRARGVAVALDVMAPDFMIAPFRRRLEAIDGTRVVPQVRREDYFATVCDADVLLLPVNFEPAAVRMVRYSMPTKVPEYLVSGVPILLYAPGGIAQVDYAEQAGWGLAVTQEAPAPLDAALERIVVDHALRQELVRRARETAAARHDAATVRATFREALSRACGQTKLSAQRHCEVV
jgi:glycosyltransferase involved in cell wall biosynthesis